MKRLGFKFKTVSPDVDEASYKIKDPKRLVETLSEAKAMAVAQKFPKAIVIGSDQMLVLGRDVFGKPHTVRNAIKQIEACSGKTIELLTAVTIIVPATTPRPRIISFIDVTKMTFRHLAREEIEAYVELDQPLYCAGSFMFEKHGISLFAAVKTSDPTAIEGLPCLKLAKHLRYALGE